MPRGQRTDVELIGEWTMRIRQLTVGAGCGLALVFMVVQPVTARASTCEAAAEESARATVAFMSEVAGVREPRGCDPADKEQLVRVLAAAANAQGALQSAQKACGRSSDIASDANTIRLIEVLKKRIAQCVAAEEGSSK
jgi:hypothetical protein